MSRLRTVNRVIAVARARLRAARAAGEDKTGDRIFAQIVQPLTRLAAQMALADLAGQTRALDAAAVQIEHALADLESSVDGIFLDDLRASAADLLGRAEASASETGPAFAPISPEPEKDPDASPQPSGPRRADP